MNPLRYIFSRTAVVAVRFRTDGMPETQLYVCRNGREAEPATEAIAGKYPTVAVCSGAGVVTRPLRGDAAEARIKSKEDEFVWNETDGGISFMRRDALAPVLSSMNDDGTIIQRIYCNISPTEAAARFRESVVWRDMFRIDERGSALCRSVVKLAMLPVLVAYLAAVAAGTVLRSGYDSRIQSLQLELMSLDAARKSASVSTVEYERLAGSFARRLPMKYSVICDRVGAGVPDGIRLTALDVEPLAKRYKSGEALKRTERLVSVTGRCSDPASVVLLTDYLAGQPPFDNVELRSVARTRDGDMEFRIEMRL